MNLVCLSYNLLTLYLIKHYFHPKLILQNKVITLAARSTNSSLTSNLSNTVIAFPNYL